LVSVITAVVTIMHVCGCVLQLMDYNTGKYKKIPEIEQLRREIGSYQLK